MQFGGLMLMRWIYIYICISLVDVGVYVAFAFRLGKLGLCRF